MACKHLLRLARIRAPRGLHLEGGYPAVWAGFERKLNRQVELQWRSAAASGRNVEWHFAEEEVADYFRPRWAKYPNIVVIYTPPEDKP
jgi:hypothetical protein